MSKVSKSFVDLTDLPFVRKEVSWNIRVFFDSNHPYKRAKMELEKLSDKERSAVDLLQLFGVWGINTNRKIAQVIRLNHDYYIPVFSSLASRVYHPTKNRWIIFSLLAGTVSIAKLEPIKLTNEMFGLVNQSLFDKRKPIRRQALSVIYAGMYPTFGLESSIKPIFRNKIIRSNLTMALNSIMREVGEDSKRPFPISLATKFQIGLMEAGVPITSQIPFRDEDVIEAFKRWFGLKEKKKSDYYSHQKKIYK